MREIRKAERKELGEFLEIKRNLEKFTWNFVWMVGPRHFMNFV
jgi:hypothetical protein